VFIGYLLAVGWTGMGEYIYIVPFLYLFSSDFSTWQLYSTLIIPALVLLAWWRRGRPVQVDEGLKGDWLMDHADQNKK